MSGTRTGAKRVLFVSRQRLVGRTNGSSAYLLDLAETVRANGFEPHLLQPTPRVAGRWPVMTLKDDLAVFASHRVRGLVRLGRFLISPSPRVWAAAGWGVLARFARRLGIGHRLFADRPFGYVVAEQWQDADLRWLERTAGEGEIAIADYMFCGRAARQLPGVRRSAIVMHDLFHSRAGATGDTVALVDRESEIAMLGQADAVIAIQSAEAAFVTEHVPAVEVLLTPMAATLADSPASGEDDRLLFVGSSTGPNVEGLRWFLDEVWPQVLAERPGARLDVAGTVAWAFPGNSSPGVTFLGMVDALEPLYRQAGVVISPLTFGSGLKIKLVEAMAQGKAIVATPVTLQGVEAVAGDCVACSEDPGEFAREIIRLAGSRRQRAEMGGRALTAASAAFGRATCHAPFADWLNRQATDASSA